MLEGGYLKIATIGGTAVRLHWTLPLGAFAFSRGKVLPFFWLGFFLVVLIHELGHALMVRSLRHRVVAIDITGFGGMCRWRGNPTPLHRSAIAWGGVAAQGILLAATWVALAQLGRLTAAWQLQLASVFTTTNLWLIIINLLPIPPLDGGRVAVGLLPNVLAAPLSRLEPYGMLILIGILIVLPLAGSQFGLNLDVISAIVRTSTGFVIRLLLLVTGNV